MNKSAARAFISYAHEDRDFVTRLLDDLASMGAEVWVDRVEMKVGDSIVRRIQDGIEESEWLIVVLSPASVESRWVNTELNAALVDELERDRVFVLPLLHRKCKIPLLLRDKLYADFTASYEAGLKLLAERITPEVDPGLLKCLLSDDLGRVRNAWNKVPDASRERYLRLLRQKLFATVNADKRAAMTALFLTDKKTLRRHLPALAADESISVVRSALFYIGELGMKEAVPIVSAKMSDGVPHIRAAAREAYRKIG